MSSSYAVQQPDVVAAPGVAPPFDPAAAATSSSSPASVSPAYTINDVAKELQPWLRWDGSRNFRCFPCFT